MSELQNERARSKEESTSAAAAARKLEAQLNAERASNSYALKRTEHLRKSLEDLKSMHIDATTEANDLKTENVNLRAKTIVFSVKNTSRDSFSTRTRRSGTRSSRESA